MFGTLIRYLRRHHIGLLALLVVMGGTAYAAESINGRDIVDGSVKGKDLKNGSVQGRDIQKDALKGSHIDEGTLDDTAPSATVAGSSPKFIENNGFVEIQKLGTGTYDLSLEKAQACSFGANFYGLVPQETGDGGTIAVAYAPGQDSLTVVLRDHAGNLVDLGVGNGPFGFSVTSGC